MAIYIIYVLVDMFKWHKECPDHIEYTPSQKAGVVHVTHKDLGDAPGTKDVANASDANDASSGVRVDMSDA